MLTAVVLIAATLLSSASAQGSSAATTPASLPATVRSTATPTSAPPASTPAPVAAPAGTSPLPLTEYVYPYSAIPYQVNPFPVGRGPQTGFNQCNSTTGGPNSKCQTAIINSLSDWCLWGSDKPNELIGNIEAAVVAYCTKDTHGARQIAAGAITGVQFMKTSAYIQITGRINQTALGLQTADFGGELDPHGADLAGNPLGGLVYSTGLPSGDNSTYKQAVEWNNFVGGGIFCFKLCDPTVTSPNYCQNIYDLIGCGYNMPASYKDNEFTSCDGDLQDEAGIYTGTDGRTTVWSQPASLPATSTLPWTPRVPASSNCRTFQSTDLFLAAATTSAAVTTGSATSAATTGAGGSSSASAAGSSSTSRTGGASHLVVGSSSLFALIGGAFLVGGAMVMA